MSHNQLLAAAQDETRGGGYDVPPDSAWQPEPDVPARSRQHPDAALLVRAVEALRAYDEYLEVPQDRGGRIGPKGRAWADFLEKKRAVLSDFDKRGEA